MSTPTRHRKSSWLGCRCTYKVAGSISAIWTVDMPFSRRRTARRGSPIMRRHSARLFLPSYKSLKPKSPVAPTEPCAMRFAFAEATYTVAPCLQASMLAAQKMESQANRVNSCGSTLRLSPVGD